MVSVLPATAHLENAWKGTESRFRRQVENSGVHGRSSVWDTAALSMEGERSFALVVDDGSFEQPM
jgi:hypothetical protein